MKIEFGALAPPLHQQVHIKGVKRNRLRGFQSCVDGIVHLLVFGALTDAEAKRARLRLLKRMAKTFPDLRETGSEQP